jgi:ankyrin repeat protein
MMSLNMKPLNRFNLFSKKKRALSHYKATALLEAAADGDEATVRTLIDIGFPLETSYFLDHTTALFIAAEKGHTKIVEMLLDAGARQDIRDTIYLNTPFLAAVERGHVDTARLLLRRGASLSDWNLREGNAALELVERRASNPVYKAMKKMFREEAPDKMSKMEREFKKTHGHTSRKIRLRA